MDDFGDFSSADNGVKSSGGGFADFGAFASNSAGSNTVGSDFGDFSAFSSGNSKSDSETVSGGNDGFSSGTGSTLQATSNSGFGAFESVDGTMEVGLQHPQAGSGDDSSFSDSKSGSGFASFSSAPTTGEPVGSFTAFRAGNPLSGEQSKTQTSAGGFGDFNTSQSATETGFGDFSNAGQGMNAFGEQQSIPKGTATAPVQQPVENTFGDFSEPSSATDFGAFSNEPMSSSGKATNSDDMARNSETSSTRDSDFGNFAQPVTDKAEPGASSAFLGQHAADIRKNSPATQSQSVSSSSADDFGDFNQVNSSAGGFAAFGSQPVSVAPSNEATRDAGENKNNDFGSFGEPSPNSANPPENESSQAMSDHGFAEFGSFSSVPSSSAVFGGQTSSKASDNDTSKKATSSNDDDDFGDFGDFNSTLNDTSTFAAFSSRPSTTTQTQAKADTKSSNDDDFDDFNSPAANASTFGAFSNTQTSSSVGTTLQSTASDDFGDFGAPSSSKPNVFSSASAVKSAPVTSAPAAAPQSAGISSSPSIDLASCGKVMRACFVVAPLVDSSLQVEKLRSSLARGGPWVELGRVGDRRLAGFEKVASGVRSDMLSSLKVEAALLGVHTAQHQQALPAFAAGMSLLEPARAPGTPEQQRTLTGIPDHMAGGEDPFSPSIRAESPLDLFGTRRPSVTAVRERVASPTGPALLDLSFGMLDNSGPASASAALHGGDLLQSDLMGLDFSMATENMPTGGTGTSSVEQNSAPLLDRTSEMAAEAERVLESLPDLSFMLSRTLMFPNQIASLA